LLNVPSPTSRALLLCLSLCTHFRR
jgi:hypothetical protein